MWLDNIQECNNRFTGIVNHRCLAMQESKEKKNTKDYLKVHCHDNLYIDVVHNSKVRFTWIMTGRQMKRDKYYTPLYSCYMYSRLLCEANYHFHV